MRKLFGILAAGALVVGAHTAAAAPVQSSVTATMTILIQGLAPVSVTGSGIVTVDTAAGTLVVPKGLVTLTSPVVVPVTAATAINSITAKVISNQAATFSVGGVTAQLPGELCPGGAIPGGQACNAGGSLGGAMGLTGAVNVAVIPNIVVIPVNLNSALVGQGGATTTPFVFDAAGWTTGVAAVNTYSAANVNGTTVATAGAGALGTATTITLVTPTFVSALGNVLPLFTSLTIAGLPTGAPAPEPGTLLLLGAGIGGLVVAGRRGRSKK